MHEKHSGDSSIQAKQGTLIKSRLKSQLAVGKAEFKLLAKHDTLFIFADRPMAGAINGAILRKV